MQSIEKTIAVINRMSAEGIIKNYALGGATAVIFYTEPIATEDIDIFVHIHSGENVFMEFQPIYDYLKNKGYTMKGEHYYVEDFPVQFLPASKNLIDKAINEAVEFKMEGGTIIRVMSPEYLVAIMLNTGRLKDYLRISVFLQHDIVDLRRLQNILAEHNLTRKWQDNVNKFQA